MASSDGGKQHEAESSASRAARARLEEALGILGITDEEATPLVVDDLGNGEVQKWLLAGRVLHRNRSMSRPLQTRSVQFGETLED